LPLLGYVVTSKTQVTYFLAALALSPRYPPRAPSLALFPRWPMRTVPMT
jgi:hypothetical protein